MKTRNASCTVALYPKRIAEHTSFPHNRACTIQVSFVDLAGSERLKKSRAQDGKETASINKSLMTLGKVISALSRRSAAATAIAAAAAVAASTGGSGVKSYLASSAGIL